MFQTATKVCDHVGIISPLVITIKFLMEELWEQDIDWVSAFPYTLTEKFKNWYAEIKNYEISRKYFIHISKLGFETL